MCLRGWKEKWNGFHSFSSFSIPFSFSFLLCLCLCIFLPLLVDTKGKENGPEKVVGEKSGEKSGEKKKRLGDENGTEQNALEAQCCCSLSTPSTTLFSASLWPMRIHINKWWMLKDASISFASVSLKRVREEKAENDNFALDGLGCCFGALSKMELTHNRTEWTTRTFFQAE